MDATTERSQTLPTTLPQPHSYELSLCISTQNGAATIGETLQSVNAGRKRVRYGGRKLRTF